MADSRLWPSGSDDRRDDSGRRLYIPYDLPTSPEFLFLEEAIAQRRSWSENITYYTGIGYLGGSMAGGALDLHDATKGAKPGEPAKIRANRVR